MKKKQSLLDRILVAMTELDKPVTALEIADHIGGNHKRISACLNERKKGSLKGKVHIARRDAKDIITRGCRPTLYFALGNEPDAIYTSSQLVRRRKYEQETAILRAAGATTSQIRRAQKEKFEASIVVAPELESQEITAKARTASKWVDRHLNALALYPNNPWATELIRAGIDADLCNPSLLTVGDRMAGVGSQS